MKLLLVMTAVVATLLVACGGDDDDSEPEASTGASSNGVTVAPVSPTETPSEGGTTPEIGPSTGGGDAPSGEAGPQRAIVTVGDETFEFDMSAACLASFGAVGGSGGAVDGSDVTLSIDIRPADLGPSDIRVEDDREATPVDWRAGGDLVGDLGIPPGSSQVDDFTIDGATASGTATFADVFAAQAGEATQPIGGTFVINCSS